MRNQDVIEKIVPPFQQIKTPNCKGPIRMPGSKVGSLRPKMLVSVLNRANCPKLFSGSEGDQ